VRIRVLRLRRFGHFADEVLDFASGDGGLQLVYGENEAGKTTVLDAIRGLLFGFHRLTPYDFRYAYRELAVEADLEFADGETASVLRLKRDKDSLSGTIADGARTIGEAWLGGKMGNPPRALFDNVFGFSLMDLERGEKALEDGGVTEALYGSGIGGGADVVRLREALVTEAERFYKPSGRNQEVPRLLSELAALRSRRDAVALRPSEYAEKQAAVKRSEEKAAAAEEAVAEAERRLALLRRVADAIPHRNELAALRRELAELAVPETFPPDGVERFERARAERDRLRQGIAAREERIGRIRGELEGLGFVERLLPRQASIEALTRETSEIAGYVRDLPKREREREDVLGAVGRGLAERGPGWTLERLRAYTPDRKAERRLTKLASERKDLDAAVQTADALRKDAERGLARARRDTESLPAARDLQAVVDLLSDREAYERRAARLEERSERIAQLRARLEVARGRLDPPCRSAEPEGLPVPPQATLREMAAENQERTSALERARLDLASAEEAVERAEAALVEGEALDTPTAEALAAARAFRERGWRLVRAAWLEGRDVSEESASYDADRPLDAAYEEAVRAADDRADALRAQADAVARREQCQRAAESARAIAAKCRVRLGEAGAEAERFGRRWESLWAECGFAPLSPEAMLEWRSDHEACVKQHAELVAEERAADELREATAAYEARVRECLGEGEESVRALLERAAADLESEHEARLRRSELARTIAEHERRLAELSAEAPELDRKRADWAARWAEFARDAGLEADADPDEAREVLGALAGLKAEFSKAPDLERRIEEMRAAVSRFEAEARSLCSELAPDLLPLPAPDAIKRLDKRLRDEEATRTAHEERTRSLEQATEELEEERVSLASAEDAMGELLRLAAADSETEFLEVAERHRRRVELSGRIREHEMHYEERRSDGSAEEFDAAIRDAQGDVIAAEVESLTGQLEALKQELARANQELGAARSEFDRMDGSAEAAQVEQEIEDRRARLRDAAERYAVLTLAGKLLTDEMERFERENQPELLRDASTFLARMTGGRYEAVRARLTDRALVTVGPGKTERTPEQLSTGTRQQLYLALRLAYIRHYCRRAEPLPLVMDDVLVNFDDRRAEAALGALAELAGEHQVLFFTCHHHLLDMAERVLPGIHPLRIHSPTA